MDGAIESGSPQGITSGMTELMDGTRLVVNGCENNG